MSTGVQGDDDGEQREQDGRNDEEPAPHALAELAIRHEAGVREEPLVATDR